MKFKNLKIINSLGCIIPNTIKIKNKDKFVTLKKGTKVTKQTINLLIKSGYEKLDFFKLEPDDLNENIAATKIASALCDLNKQNLEFKKLNTGRTNIRAKSDGLFFYNYNDLTNLNKNPDVAISAIKPFSKVKKGQDLVTVKVIPYGIKMKIVKNLSLLSKNCFQLHPFKRKNIHFIQTYQSKNEKFLEKSEKTTLTRLKSCGIDKVSSFTVKHDIDLISRQITESLKNSELILIIGPHAITHLKDVIPTAIIKSGAKILRYGIPVEPGNLLLLSKFTKQKKNIYIIGMPSCAKSPKENGLDWILWKIIANVKFNKSDIAKLSIGGLIK